MSRPPPPDSELPFRLKESTFRIYEPYISAAIRGSPESVNVNPAPLRATTFAARLRDACVSYDKFRWPTKDFTALEFDELYNHGGLVVSHSDQNVSLGPRLTRKGSPAGQSLSFSNPNDKRLQGLLVDREIDSPTIHAFCLLLAQKLISGPVILTANALADDQVSKLEEAYDVAITENDKGQSIIL